MPSSGGNEWHTAACPYAAGSDNRLQVYNEGDAKGGPHIWCRECRMWAPIGTGAERAKWTPSAPITPKPLEVDWGKSFHSQLRAVDLAYYSSRGISPAWVHTARLGWTGNTPGKRYRYSIPCYDPGWNLWALQYRHRDPDYSGPDKYISQSGGSNNRLFLAPYYVLKALPYVLVEESPLDALTWCSMGIPAIAPFSGGRTSNAWLKDWTVWLPPTVVIIAQNDGGKGDAIALARLAAIGRGTVKRIPKKKDVSQMIAAGLDPLAWLRMPAIKELIDPRRSSD